MPSVGSPAAPRLLSRPASGGRVPKKRKKRGSGLARPPKKRRVAVSREEEISRLTKKERIRIKK